MDTIILTSSLNGYGKHEIDSSRREAFNGSLWSTIRETATMMKSFAERDREIQALMKPQAQHSQREGSRSTLDMLCRTLCVGFDYDDWDTIRTAFYADRHNARFVQWLYWWNKWFPAYTIFCVVLPVLNVLRACLGIRDSIFGSHRHFDKYDKSGGRPLFRTAAGRIGLGPPLARDGDQIFLCSGGRLPLVLRKSGENWSLVGDCYIDSMAHGEYWNEDRCERIWLE